MTPTFVVQTRKNLARLGVACAALSLCFSALAKLPSAAPCIAAHRAVTEHRDEVIEVIEVPVPAVTTDGPSVAEALNTTAASVFAQCATHLFGPAATPRAAACEADLYTLPVLLLYRADGLSRAQAEDDLKRPGNEETSPAAARRTADMLSFVYQGRGPAGEGASAWIAKRTDDWTSACLLGQR